MTTDDGLITVEPPAGWLFEQVVGARQGNDSVTFVKAKRPPPEFFFLMAKDYTVNPVHAATPEQLVREIYPALYTKTFARVRIDVVTKKVIDGREWWEAGYQFVHTRLGAIAKLERVTCVGEHVLLVSGEGAQEDVRTHYGTLSQWMDGARFGSLG
jgi:hypothetical protein